MTGLTAATPSAPTPPRRARRSRRPRTAARSRPGRRSPCRGTARTTGGGVVGGVEVSTDGGTTWHRANGRGTWTYTWAAGSSGTVHDPQPRRRRQRQHRDAVARASPSRSAPATRAARARSGRTARRPAVAPRATRNAVEVGVKFRADADGRITGLRFYKGVGNTGTHVGHLWTRTGTLLATATFTSETATGWQQVNLSHAGRDHRQHDLRRVLPRAERPLRGQRGLLRGRPASTRRRCTRSGDGVDGGNGVYGYGPSGTFPTGVYRTENYWVDVVFDTARGGGGDTTPPTVSVDLAGIRRDRVRVNANVTATFNEAMGAATITTTTSSSASPAGAVVPGDRDLRRGDHHRDARSERRAGELHDLHRHRPRRRERRQGQRRQRPRRRPTRGASRPRRRRARAARAASGHRRRRRRSRPRPATTPRSRSASSSAPRPTAGSRGCASTRAPPIRARTSATCGPHRHAARHRDVHQRDRLRLAAGDVRQSRWRSRRTRRTSPPTTRRAATTRSARTSSRAAPSTTRRCARSATARTAATASTATAPSGTFPTGVYRTENYWVDVVFDTSTAPTRRAPRVTGELPPDGSAGRPAGDERHRRRSARRWPRRPSDLDRPAARPGGQPRPGLGLLRRRQPQRDARPGRRRSPTRPPIPRRVQGGDRRRRGPRRQRARRRPHVDVHHRGPARPAARRGRRRPDPRDRQGVEPVHALLRGDPARRGPDAVHGQGHQHRHRGDAGELRRRRSSATCR